MAHVNLTVEAPFEWLNAKERKDWIQSFNDAVDKAVADFGSITDWKLKGVDSVEEDTEPSLYSWNGWEAEPETTGDGSGDPEKFFITIRDPEGEEYALIVHRVCGGKHPLSGSIAVEKERRAQNIVDALNAQAEARSEGDSNCYYLDLGVDADEGERLLAAHTGPFSSRAMAVVFAQGSRGQCAAKVREELLGIGLDVSDPDVSYRELDSPILGATLVTYVEGRDEPVETDLY